MNIASILALLPKVGPVVAALPEFKRLFDELVGAFDSKADQDDLRAAYELAIDEAAEAHAELSALVARRS